MEWSTVSNAVVRSNNTSSTGFLASREMRISLCTLSSADSVLWRVLKPDWSFSRMLLSSTNDWSWRKTTFSKTFDRNDRFDTGLKFDRTAGSRLGFLRRGLTTACLNTFGTDPELRQLLINVRRPGPTVLKTCAKKRSPKKIKRGAVSVVKVSGGVLIMPGPPQPTK